MKMKQNEETVPEGCVTSDEFMEMYNNDPELKKKVDFLHKLKKDATKYIEKTDEGLFYNLEKFEAAYEEVIQKPFVVWPKTKSKTNAAGETSELPYSHVDNLQELLNAYELTVRYNEMSKATEIQGEITAEVNADTLQNDFITMVKDLAREHNYPVSDIQPHLDLIASKNSYHPFRKMIKEITWDGTDRFEDVFSAMGCVDDDIEFSKQLFRLWCYSVALAPYAKKIPTFKTQGILVLCGPQGAKKTSYFESLIPERGKLQYHGWFKDGFILDSNNKDSVATYTSHLIVEFGELEATTKKSDIANLKAFITNKDDKFRTAYAYKANVYRRQTVPCASVNGTSFLEDTENRRFWVIEVHKCNPNHGVDMEQFWKQMFTEATAYNRWWLTPSEQRKLEDRNKNYKTENGLIELFDRWFTKPNGNDEMDLNCTEMCEIMNYTRGIGSKKERGELKEYLLSRGFQYLKHSKKFRVSKRKMVVDITGKVVPDYRSNDLENASEKPQKNRFEEMLFDINDDNF